MVLTCQVKWILKVLLLHEQIVKGPWVQEQVSVQVAWQIWVRILNLQDSSSVTLDSSLSSLVFSAFTCNMEMTTSPLD